MAKVQKKRAVKLPSFHGKVAGAVPAKERARIIREIRDTSDFVETRGVLTLNDTASGSGKIKFAVPESHRVLLKAS